MMLDEFGGASQYRFVEESSGPTLPWWLEPHPQKLLLLCFSFDNTAIQRHSSMSSSFTISLPCCSNGLPASKNDCIGDGGRKNGR